MKAHAITLAGVFVLAAAASAPAATIRVDWSGQGDYLTIREGIDASTHGDSVLVAPGTYTGALNRDIDFGGRNINLIAEGGRDLTTIDCQSEGRAFVFSGRETPYATVEGFTVRNGSAEEGGAVHITNSSISFMECAFENNSGAFGGCFFIGREGKPFIERCTLTDNYASEYGGGIYAYSARPYICECDFIGNEAGANGGAISCKTWTVASIQDNRFLGNTAHDGGAIYVGTLFVNWDENLERTTTILSNKFFDNSAERGGAVFLNSFSWVRVSWSTFARNSAREGGALYCYMGGEGDLTVQMCTIVQNSAEVGGGICVSGSSPDNGLTVLQTIIAFSTEGKAEHMLDYAPILSDLCCAYGNEGGDFLYGATDRILQVDPLFCDMYGGDYNLCENSECRSANNIWGFTFGSYRGICGPCSSPVETKSWGAIKAMYR
jgi:predicted outer membrane repeat protein